MKLPEVSKTTPGYGNIVHNDQRYSFQLQISFLLIEFYNNTLV